MSDPTLNLLIQTLGFPVSDPNQSAQILKIMAKGEGMPIWTNNPLASTQYMPGATAWNTLPGGGHVWIYPTPEEGVAASIATLKNGNYPNIWALLQQHAPLSAYNTSGVQHDLWNWQQGPNSWKPGAITEDWKLLKQAIGDKAAIQQETKTGNAQVSNLPNPLDWASGLGKLIGWLLNGQHWWQIAFVGGGAVLVLVGIGLVKERQIVVNVGELVK